MRAVLSGERALCPSLRLIKKKRFFLKSQIKNIFHRSSDSILPPFSLSPGKVRITIHFNFHSFYWKICIRQTPTQSCITKWYILSFSLILTSWQHWTFTDIFLILKTFVTCLQGFTISYSSSFFIFHFISDSFDGLLPLPELLLLLFPRAQASLLPLHF